MLKQYIRGFLAEARALETGIGNRQSAIGGDARRPARCASDALPEFIACADMSFRRADFRFPIAE
jgi:hypothetical protein